MAKKEPPAFVAETSAHKRGVEVNKRLARFKKDASQNAARLFRQSPPKEVPEGAKIQPLQSKELVTAAAEGRKDDFFKRLSSISSGLTEEQLTAAYNACLLLYLQQYGSLLNRDINEAIRGGDTLLAARLLEESATNGQQRKALGESDAEEKNLREIGIGLTDAQKGYLLGAALKAGFTITAVLRVDKGWGYPTKLTGAERDILKIARETAMKMAHGLIKAQQDRDKKRVDELEKKLAALLDSAKHAKNIRKSAEKQDKEMMKDIEEALAAALERSMLRSGRLGEVQPRVEGPV